MQGLAVFEVLCVGLQRGEEIFQREREGQRVAAGPKVMPCHVSVGIERLGSLGLLPHVVLIAGLHGHADQSGDAGARADGFHDRDLLLGEPVGCIARPHVVSKGQGGKLSSASLHF